MSKGINKAIIVGYVGNDPDIRPTQSGIVASFNVATSTEKNAQKEYVTEWHRITAFGKLAEIVKEYVRKKSQVYIEGRIQTQKWKDKAGNERSTTGIIASEMQLLGPKADRGEQTFGQEAPGTSFADDDIPF